MVIAKCSLVLQNLSLKLPCSFVNMGQWNLLTLFDEIRFQLKVFCLADIFSLSNELSYSLQDKNKSQIEAAEEVSAFKKKLSLRKKKVKKPEFCYVFTVGSVKLMIRKSTIG